MSPQVSSRARASLSYRSKKIVEDYRALNLFALIRIGSYCTTKANMQREVSSRGTCGGVLDNDSGLFNGSASYNTASPRISIEVSFALEGSPTTVTGW